MNTKTKKIKLPRKQKALREKKSGINQTPSYQITSTVENSQESNGTSVKLSPDTKLNQQNTSSKTGMDNNENTKSNMDDVQCLVNKSSSNDTTLNHLNEEHQQVYDSTNISDILRHANDLIGMSFREVLENTVTDKHDLAQLFYYYNIHGNKGKLGTLIEKYYFKYSPNSNVNPDFEEVGLELKVTPYELSKKSGKPRAGERLVISMIPADKPIETDFFNSSLFKKLRLML